MTIALVTENHKSISITQSILRRYFPKSTALSVYTQKQLDEMPLIINSTPRKILNYKKPLDLALVF